MWPTGSLPERLGIPPVRRTQRASLEAEYPWTLSAPRTVWRTARAPRESIQMMAGPMDSPASSTGTVPDHCEVHPTPTIRSGSTPLSERAPSRGHDGVPPRPRGLFGTAVLGQVDTHGLERMRHDAARRREHGDLGPAGPEVHREDIGLLAAGLGDWAEVGGRHGPQARRWCGHGGEAYPAAPAPFRAGHRSARGQSVRPASVSISITTLLPTTTLPSSSEWLKLTPKSRRSISPGLRTPRRSCPPASMRPRPGTPGRIDGLGDASDGEVAGHHPVGVVDPLQPRALRVSVG